MNVPSSKAETLAKWREAGEWWSGKAPREVHRFVDERGSRRETIAELPPLSDYQIHETPKSVKTDYRWIREPLDGKYPFSLGEVREPHLVQYKAQASTYTALHVMSGCAFGRGTMFASELGAHAAERGIASVLMADPMSLAWAVEFCKTAKKVGVKPLVGATFEMPEGGEIVLVARNKAGYRSLSRLITACHLEEPRLFPMCTWERLERHTEGLLCLTGGDEGPLDHLLLSGNLTGAQQFVERLISLYGRDKLFVQVERSDLPWQLRVNRALLELAEKYRVLPVAGGVVTHEKREDFPAQDMLVCIETLCLIDEIEGRKPRRDPTQPEIPSRPRRALNAERYLKTPLEMSALYCDRPDLLLNTMRVAEMCEPDVLPGRTQLPKLCENEEAALREITTIGAMQRYKRIGKALNRRIEFELERIIRLNYAGHFMVAWDMCNWAREQGILLSGRGSVVDSVVAYCLGFSRIDAFDQNLFFDRFLPADGSKRPDIDIDFEAFRRDDVRNYLCQKYGDEHVATVAAIGTYATRGIVREVGKVMSIPQEDLDYLSKRLHGSVAPDRLEKELDSKPELRNSHIPRERFHWVFRLAEKLMEVPRNIRSHSSGVVISRTPLADTVPVMYSGAENVKIIQWDKRSAKMCFDKFDVLCLRGNDVLGDTQRRVRVHQPGFNSEDLPAVQDPEVYRTMRSGNLIGVPQSASPAMRQAHMRVQTQDLKDAGIVQAAIRPGVGGAVKINEYIARRRGKPYSFLHPELEAILGKTHGIVVFQEQIDMLLQTFGGYSSDEAETTREAIHKRRREEYARSIRDEVYDRIKQKGFSLEVANEVYELVAGFQGYGFAEGHALAFAEISIRSIWCQQNYPAEYFAALLDAQPAGYYGPYTLVNEARIRGIKVLPPQANKSVSKFSVEDVMSDEDPKLIIPNGAIRVGLNQVEGLSKETRERMEVPEPEVKGPKSEVRGPGDTQLVRADKGELESLRDAFSTGSRPTLPSPPAIEVYQNAYGGHGSGGQGSRCEVGAARSEVQGLSSKFGTSDPEFQISNPGPRTFSSFFDFVAKVRPTRDELELLILCGYFDCFESNRKALLWAIPSALEYANLVEASKNFLPFGINEPPLPTGIEPFSKVDQAVYERKILGLDIEQHLVAYERERVRAKGGITAAEASRAPNGTKAFVVGNPIRLRFPPTASGRRVMFFDLEDETGLLNVTCFDDVYQRYGHAVICHPYITLWGEAQDRDGHIAFMAHSMYEYKPALQRQIQVHDEIPLRIGDFLMK